MTKLILKWFVYNKERSASEQRTQIGTVGGIVGILLNALLALGKAVAGLLFGSIALVADAANNLTDAAGSIITLLGFKLAAKKPDRDHPYGHGRMEYLSGLMMAFVVLLLGLALLKSSVEQILHPEAMTFSYLSVTVMAVSILGKLWLTLFYKKLQKLTGSATFGATATDSRNDAITTAAVLVSTVIYAVWGLNIDGYTGLAVSLLILYSAVGLIRETIDPLLGQPPSDELVQEIYAKAMSYEGVLGVHDLVLHNYGPGRMFLCFHAEVNAREDMMKSHDLIDDIEKDFYNDMDLETVIHLDPIIIDDPIINDLKEHARAILTALDENLTLHDFRAVVGPGHTNLIFDVVLPAELHGQERAIKERFDSLLRAEHPECNSVITFDKSYV